MASLSTARVIEAAIALADRDGLDAVTLRRIAAELGVHVTSLYNHVPAGDAVTQGIADALIEQASLPTGAIGWEAWVRAFVDAVGAIAVAHPGAFVALQRRPVQGARATASFEVALAAFTRAGLDDVAAYFAVKAATYVAMSIAVERALRASGATAQTALDRLPADSFPHVRALAAHDDAGAAWAFSVETLVGGLRGQIRRARSAA